MLTAFLVAGTFSSRALRARLPEAYAQGQAATMIRRLLVDYGEVISTPLPEDTITALGRPG